MSLFTKLGNDIAAPVDAAGNKRSVENIDFQRWMTEVERLFASFQAGGGVIFPDLATANASLDYGPNQMAWVIGDSTPANNGIYQKQGGSGSGSWARVADLPYSFIVASDVGDGTPDAIVATSSLPVSGSALVLLNIFEANTGSPVTVSFNGGSPLTVKTNSGNDIAPGGLQSGMLVMGRVSGTTFRLVSDQVSAAIAAQAEAAQAAAEAAAAGVDLPPVTANTMLVDNAAGTARESKTFPEVVSLLGIGSGLDVVADRTALAALDVSKVSVALLDEGVRTGIFRKVLISSLSAELQTAVTTDNAASQGVFVVSTDDPLYVWMRNDFRRWELDARWFGVVVDTSGATAANTTAFQNMIALIPAAGTIKLGLGLAYTNDLTITKPISWEGKDKLRSGLISNSVSNDSPILNYPGTTGSRIQDISVRRMSFWGADGGPVNKRAMNLTWVNKSTFEDLYFYNLRRGITGNNMWCNSFKNISCQGLTGSLSWTFHLEDECNNCHFDRVEFRGFDGCKVTGNCGGLSFVQCDFEGIEGPGGTGLHLAPTTGKKVSGVFVASYFENIAGAGIRCAAADNKGVEGLSVNGSYFYGANANATQAMVLTNVSSFDIRANQIIDWPYAFFFDATAKNGTISKNGESITTSFQQGTPDDSVTITRSSVA